MAVTLRGGGEGGGGGGGYFQIFIIFSVPLLAQRNIFGNDKSSIRNHVKVKFLPENWESSAPISFIEI